MMSKVSRWRTFIHKDGIEKAKEVLDTLLYSWKMIYWLFHFVFIFFCLSPKVKELEDNIHKRLYDNYFLKIIFILLNEAEKNIFYNQKIILYF